MEPGSSNRNQGNRGRSSSQNRNRSGNRSRSGGSRSGGSRSGGSRNGGSRGGSSRSGSSQGGRGNANRGRRNRDRKPAPKPTGWQKFVKAITLGLVDPFEAQQAKKRAARKKARKKPISIEPTGPRLYVGNLDYGVTEEDLEATFSKVGKVKQTLVVKQGRTGRSKGFGFVEMSNLEEAKAAVRKLNDSDLKGRSMLVTGAKTEKPEKKEDGEWKPSGDRNEGGSKDGQSSSRSGDRRESRSRGERGERGRRSSKERSGEKESRTVKPRQVAVVESAFVTVSKLNVEASEEDIHDLFDGVGKVEKRGDQISESGSLVVEMASQEDAQKAVSLLDGKSFMGSQIKVSEAPESDRSDLRVPAEFESAAVTSVAASSTDDAVTEDAVEAETVSEPEAEEVSSSEEASVEEEVPAAQEKVSVSEEEAPATQEEASAPEEDPTVAEEEATAGQEEPQQTESEDIIEASNSNDDSQGETEEKPETS